MNLPKSLRRTPGSRRRGQSQSEYAILVAIISLAAIVFVVALGGQINAVLGNVASSIFAVPSSIGNGGGSGGPDLGPVARTFTVSDPTYSNTPVGGAVAADGTLYLVTTDDGGAGVILHFDTAGTMDGTINPPGGSAKAAAVGPDGALYVAGTNGSGHAMVTKYNAGGGFAWTTNLPDGSQGSALAAAPDGSGVYLSGLTWAASPATTSPFDGQSTAVGSPFLVHLASGGGIDWSALPDAAHAVRALPGLALAPNGHTAYLVGMTTGSLTGTTNSSEKAFILALDTTAAGALRWSGFGAAGSYGWGATVAPDGSVYMSGVSGDGSGSGRGDILLNRYGGDGSLTWSHSQAGTAGSEFVTSAVVGPQGYIYVSGSTTSSSLGGRANIGPAGTADLFLVIYKPNGTTAADPQRWGSTGDDWTGTAMSAVGLPAGPIWVFGSAPDGSTITGTP